MNGKFVQNVPTILGMNSSEFAAMMGSFTPNLMEGWSEEEFVANLGPMLHVSGDVSKDFLKRAKKNYKMDSNDKMRYSKLFLQTYADDVSENPRQRTRLILKYFSYSWEVYNGVMKIARLVFIGQSTVAYVKIQTNFGLILTYCENI